MDVVAVVAPQRLLVPRSSERALASAFLPQQEVHLPRGVLTCLVECQDPRGAMPDLVREDRLYSVDEEERGLASRLVAVVRMDHNMDWSSSYQPLPQASSLFLKVLILRPFRTSALARSAWPLFLGCATEA